MDTDIDTHGHWHPNLQNNPRPDEEIHMYLRHYGGRVIGKRHNFADE
jgi:hypothetical protein